MAHAPAGPFLACFPVALGGRRWGGGNVPPGGHSAARGCSISREAGGRPANGRTARRSGRQRRQGRARDSRGAAVALHGVSSRGPARVPALPVPPGWAGSASVCAAALTPRLARALPALMQAGGMRKGPRSPRSAGQITDGQTQGAEQVRARTPAFPPVGEPRGGGRGGLELSPDLGT